MAQISMDFDENKLMRGFVDIEKASFVATKNTLDTMAGLTRKNAVKNVGSDFIERNTFTKRNIQFQKSSGTKISDLESRAGATERAAYMKLQEGGGERKTKKGNNLAIATNKARGGSHLSLVSRSNYLKAIKKNKIRGKFKKNIRSPKARSVAAAFVAKRENKFITRTTGIYRIDRFKKTGRNRIKFKRSMIYNTQQRKARVRSNPWLEPATEKPIQDGQAIFNSNVNKLLKKDVI